MANSILQPVLAGLLILAAVPVASAQSVFSPYNVNPYSRSSLSPYINFSRSVGGDYDFRNPLVRPAMIVPDFLAAYDAIRASAGRPDYSLPANSFEEWFKQRENETRFSPSGHPIGFMIYGPYYDLPNQNSFVPTAPNRGRIYR